MAAFMFISNLNAQYLKEISLAELSKADNANNTVKEDFGFSETSENPK